VSLVGLHTRTQHKFFMLVLSLLRFVLLLFLHDSGSPDAGCLFGSRSCFVRLLVVARPLLSGRCHFFDFALV